jgi:hypothetical protein
LYFDRIRCTLKYRCSSFYVTFLYNIKISQKDREELCWRGPAGIYWYVLLCVSLPTKSFKPTALPHLMWITSSIVIQILQDIVKVSKGIPVTGRGGP